jgi:hypothetical protein
MLHSSINALTTLTAATLLLQHYCYDALKDAAYAADEDQGMVYNDPTEAETGGDVTGETAQVRA